MIFLFLLSLALLGFWIGWRSQHCYRWWPDDVESWVSWLFLPALTFMAWLGVFIFAYGKGWL